MSKITISNLNNKQVVSHNNSKTVLSIMHENFIDWMHACGGKGRCTTCKMKIIEGYDQISLLSDFEEKMRKVRRLAANERLACQCSASGDITVEVPEDCKLPHINYSY